MEKGSYFVTGIDTDIGKSYATGILAKKLAGKGFSVITQKFIQTGSDGFDGRSVDIALHRRIMGIGLLPRDMDGTTAPLVFDYPASPHLAAEIEKREIDLTAVDRSRAILEKEYDIVLMEGAGGLAVPVTYDYNTLDYVAGHSLPLIVVTSGRLGSISHTVLTLEAALAREVKVVMLIYNRHLDADKMISDSTLEYLKRWLEKHIPDCEIMEISTI